MPTKKTSTAKKDTVKKTTSEKSEKAEKNTVTVPEAVVPADIEEKPAKSRPVKKKAAPAKPKEKEPSYFRNVGTYSSDISSEFAFTSTTQIEEEEKTYRFMRQCARNGEILVGTLVTVAADEKNLSLRAYLLFEPSFTKEHYGQVEVMIPEELFFGKNPDFGKRYSSKTPYEQFKVRKNRLLKYQNAKIHFCVLGVSRDKSDDPRFAGQKITTVIGDRNKAMGILRDMFFFHKNRKIEGQEPRSIEIGDTVEAFVVNALPQFVTVATCGVETKIYLNDLCLDPINSCLRYTHVGEVLPRCEVLDVKIRDDETVELRLTNNTTRPSKSILTLTEGSCSTGRVAWYNKDKQIYIIHLVNGVTALVKDTPNNVIPYQELAINDVVSVCITHLAENKVMGNATKI